MKKKKLKTLDVKDLEADYDKKIVGEQKEEVSESVDVRDLDLPSRSSIAPQKKVEKVVKKFDPSLHAQRKKINSLKGDALLNHMTSRYRFDRSKTQYWVYAIIIAVVAYGMLGEAPDAPSGGLEKQLDSSFNVIALLGSGLYGMIQFFFDKMWFLTAFGIYIFFPLKKLTPTMIEVSYDGLTLPDEVLPLGKHMRRRVYWRTIKKVSFKTKRMVPILQLFGRDGDRLGEMRLDVDDPASLYKCIEVYAPKENPIRILFQNKKS